MRVIIIGLCVLAISCAEHSPHDLSKVCLAPVKTSAGLKRLNQIGWKQLDSLAVQSIWPHELARDNDCTVGDEKVSLPCFILSEGYCTKSVCYCSAAFDFTLRNGKEEFDSLTIMYSTTRRDEIESVSQEFLRSLAPIVETFSYSGTDDKGLSRIFHGYDFVPGAVFPENSSGSAQPIQIDIQELRPGLWWMRLYVTKPIVL